MGRGCTGVTGLTQRSVHLGGQAPPLSLAQTSCYICKAYHLNDRCSKRSRTVYSFSPWGKARVSREEEEEMSLTRGDCPTQAGFYRSQVTHSEV